MTDSNADPQKSFGELRSTAHALTGDERWTTLCELLNDWPQPHLQEIVIPYLEELLRDDTSARQAPEHWLRAKRDQLNIHPAFVLARSCAYCEEEVTRLNLFVSSPLIQNLTSLDLYDSSVGVEGAQALACSSTLSNLRELTLDFNRIGDRGAIALANSTHLTHLTALYVGENNIGDEGAAAIANSPHLADSIRTPWMS